MALYGPDKGLHHLTKTGRRMTAGEIAQCGRGVMASANEDGDGPAATVADLAWMTYNPWEALKFSGTRREACALTVKEITSMYRAASRRAHPDRGGTHLGFVALGNAKDYLVDLLTTGNTDVFTASACHWLRAEAYVTADDEEEEMAGLRSEPPPADAESDEDYVDLTGEPPPAARAPPVFRGFETPGVHMLHRTLDSTWRSRTRSAMSTAETRHVAMQARRTLKESRPTLVRTTKADKAIDEAKSAAKKRMAALVAKSRIAKALSRQLKASQLDMEERIETGRTRSTFAEAGPRSFGPRVLKQ